MRGAGRAGVACAAGATWTDPPASTLVSATGSGKELIDLDASHFAAFGDHGRRWLFGLRKNSADGFGGTVPVPQATSGGYM